MKAKIIKTFSILFSIENAIFSTLRTQSTVYANFFQNRLVHIFLCIFLSETLLNNAFDQVIT